MENAIKSLHRAKLVPALLSIAFGVALIIARKGAMDVAVKIGAVMLMAAGAGGLAMFLFGPVKEKMNLVVGGILAVLGILAWACSETLVDLFPVIAGITLILNGMSNLATLSQTPEKEYAGTWLIVLFSVIMIAGGVFILWHPAQVEDFLLVYVGISYIVNGLFDLIILYRVKRFLLPPDVKE